MIANPDGSIILEMDLDTSNLDGKTKKLIDSLTKKYDKLQEKIKETETKIQDLGKANDKIISEGFETPSGEIYISDKAQADYDKNEAEIEKLKGSLGNLKNEATKTGEAIKNAQANVIKDSKKTTDSVDKIGNGFEKLGKRISGLVKRVFIFSLITKALRAMRSAIGDVLKDDKEFSESLNRLKASLMIAFTPLINIIIPALKTFVDWITYGITSLTKFIAELFRVPYSKLVADAKKFSAKASKETKKAVKSQLAAFDELNTLNRSDESTADAANSLASAFEKVGSFDIGFISESLGILMEVVGGALTAVGLILLFLGHPAIGIAAIIGGLWVWSIGKEKIKQTDPTYNIKNQLSDLMSVVGLSLVAIGLILIAFGQYAWGVGAVIGGLALFHISEASINPGKITSLINDVVRENALLLFSVGWGLAFIGAILCVTGVGIPLGVSMIVAGASLFGTTLALNWDRMPELIKEVGKKILKIFNWVWDGIKIGFKALLNDFIDSLNIWVDIINFFLAPLRDAVELFSIISGKKISSSKLKIPHIPKLANGGIVPYATTAIIGEKGREAVLPLENNTEWMDTLAAKIASIMPAESTGGRIEIPLYLDGREIARAVRGGEDKLGNQTVFGRFANAY